MSNKLTICSVLMVTFNHEKYIAKAIDSVIMQKTNFDYEIVIGEDCSTDKTREIVLDYKARYPDKIKLHLQEKNGGMMPNFINTLKSCSGKYIAMLDGDDYWTDPNKLQKQVDILETHPEYSLCFTARNIVDNNGGILQEVRYKKNLFNTKDVLKGFVAFTHTVLFRNNVKLIAFLSDNYSYPSGDVLVSYFYTLLGEIYYLDEITASYRITGNGVWTNYSEDEKSRMGIERLKELHKIVGLGPNSNLLAEVAIGRFSQFIKDNFRKPENIFRNFKILYSTYLKPFNLHQIIIGFVYVAKAFIQRKFFK